MRLSAMGRVIHVPGRLSPVHTRSLIVCQLRGTNRDSGVLESLSEEYSTIIVRMARYSAAAIHGRKVLLAPIRRTNAPEITGGLVVSTSSVISGFRNKVIALALRCPTLENCTRTHRQLIISHDAVGENTW
jgi:hypothetical protein